MVAKEIIISFLNFERKWTDAIGLRRDQTSEVRRQRSHFTAERMRLFWRDTKTNAQDGRAPPNKSAEMAPGGSGRAPVLSLTSFRIAFEHQGLLRHAT